MLIDTFKKWKANADISDHEFDFQAPADAEWQHCLCSGSGSAQTVIKPPFVIISLIHYGQICVHCGQKNPKEVVSCEPFQVHRFHPVSQSIKLHHVSRGQGVFGLGQVLNPCGSLTFRTAIPTCP